MKGLLQDKRSDVDTYFRSTREKQADIIRTNFQRVYQNYNNNQHVDLLMNEVENELLQEIRELYSLHKVITEQNQLTDRMIDQIFLQKWDELSQNAIC